MQSQQSSRSCVILGVAAAVHEPWGQQSPWNFAKLGTGFAQATSQNNALGWTQVGTPQIAPRISPWGQSMVHDAVGTGGTGGTWFGMVFVTGFVGGVGGVGTLGGLWGSLMNAA